MKSNLNQWNLDNLPNNNLKFIFQTKFDSKVLIWLENTSWIFGICFDSIKYSCIRGTLVFHCACNDIRVLLLYHQFCIGTRIETVSIRWKYVCSEKWKIFNTTAHYTEEKARRIHRFSWRSYWVGAHFFHIHIFKISKNIKSN